MNCKRTTVAAAAAVALWGGAAWAALPFVEKFDERSDGMLNGQNGWRAVATSRVNVEADTVFGGTKAGSISNAVLWRNVSDAATDVWVDWYVKPSRRMAGGDPTPGTNSAAAFYVNSQGYLRVLSNTTWMTLPAFTVPENDWTRLTVRLDYTGRKWSIYACDGVSNRLARPLATNLAFRAGAGGSSVSKLRVAAAGGGKNGYLDSVSVGGNTGSGVPLNIDHGGDGISDRWELHYFGTATNRNDTSDADRDGWTDKQEYLAGTDPTNAVSYMRVLDCDLTSPLANDIAFRLIGGGSTVTSVYAGDLIGRSFSVQAANNIATNAKLTAVSVRDTLTGTNALTDVGAASLYTARFYDVGATFGGEACTNAEQWAMFVQDRPSNRSELICVPVHYGPTASNNLNATLGRQLARGLYASDTKAQADKVRWIDGSGAWVDYYLSVTHGWTEDGVAPADVTMTAGQALWVVHSNAAARANTVFAGRTFAETNVTAFTVKTEHGGWTLFGWPLPVARGHAAGSADKNQLGFEQYGTGGRSYDRTASNSGDQIWVRAGNGWRYYMLLDNHAAGDELDGRWWGDGTGGGNLATFSLQPGQAYYYYHTPNYAATNFTWKPKLP